MTTAPTALDTSSDAYLRARKQVRMLRSWYLHALIYACVIGGLWLLYALGLPLRATAHPGAIAFPLAPTLGWGVGVAIHGIAVWSRVGRLGRDWEERKIRELLQRG